MRLSREQWRARLTIARDQGQSPAQLALRLGCTTHAVMRAERRVGVRLPRAPKGGYRRQDHLRIHELGMAELADMTAALDALQGGFDD